MTAPPSPPLVEHPRSTEEIAAILRRRLHEAGFAEPGMDPLADAITWIAARFGNGPVDGMMQAHIVTAR